MSISLFFVVPAKAKFNYNHPMKIIRGETVLREHLISFAKRLSASSSPRSKARIRSMHSGKRLAVMASMNGSFKHHLELLRNNLARPSEIDISSITPRLDAITAGTEDSHLFTAASLLWSVPVSKGFGRRMRYLVRDDYNGKLIGIIGLTDPVFNLTPRDAWVGWNSDDRKQRLTNVMDAFVLGALPPYNKILGGKLVALLATSTEMVSNFREKYRSYTGIISASKKDPRLVLLTTSSALGRSSIYNRLRIPNGVAYLTNIENDRVPTWHTQGYGHFHISNEMFAELKKVLIRRSHPYATGNRFGDGCNWRIRVIRQAAMELGVNMDVLKHGIRRPVYVVPLARNAREVLLGKSKRPIYMTSSVEKIAEYWRQRWAVPRAQRYPNWYNWNIGGVLTNLRRLHTTAEKGG